MRKNQAIAGVVGVGGAMTAAGALAAARGRRAAAFGLWGLAAAGAWSAFAPRSRGFGPIAWHGPGDVPRMSITFDDGPSESTGPILDALADADAKATFFVLGRQARRFPHHIARMVRDGHEVANHGDDHGILILRGPGHVRRQLARCREAVEAAAGPGSMGPLFRAPHGFRGPATWLAARSAGYNMAGWGVGVFDSAEPGVDVIVQRCNDALYPGSVLLLHDADGWNQNASRPQTAAAVPHVLREARARGLQLVTMSDLTRPTP